MKALKCLGCKNYVIVSDNTVGYCEKCKTPLQEDIYLKKELNLQPDEPIKRKYIKIKKNDKIKKISRRKNIK